MYMVTMDFSHETIVPEAARPVTWEVWSVRQAILMVSLSRTGSDGLIKQCCLHQEELPFLLNVDVCPHNHGVFLVLFYREAVLPQTNTGVTKCQSLLIILNLNIHLSKWFSYWHKLAINEFF